MRNDNIMKDRYLEITIKQINQPLITLSIMPISDNELAPLKAA